MLKLIQGDCNKVMRTIRRNTIDTIITDPPYAINFMGKAWDYELPSVRCFKRMLRIAKPGAILLCFGGTRTFHRITCNIEDAGWIIKDCIMWLYGSGFPKSHNISKAIDKAKGKKRKIIGKGYAQPAKSGWKFINTGTLIKNGRRIQKYITENNTKLAQLWDGYGTGLKPAFEPIIVAMKPLEGTYAQNAEKYGVAGLNIDGGRIRYKTKQDIKSQARPNCTGRKYGGKNKGAFLNTLASSDYGCHKVPDTQGRWPANLILDEEAARMLDKQTGDLFCSGRKNKGTCKNDMKGTAFGNNSRGPIPYFDNGGASRFFYTAKASKKERNLGLEHLKAKKKWPGGVGTAISARDSVRTQNTHPTVKPLKLMEYLCKLTKTPFGGIVLDPFMGTSTTGMACKITGRHFIGIELDKDYCKIARLRMKATKRTKPENAVSKKKIFKA